MRSEQDVQGTRNEAFIEALGTLLRPMLHRWFAPEVRGLDHLPEGKALLVGNHSGGMSTPDTFVLCSAILEQRGVAHIPWGLAHDLPFRLPGLRALMYAIGGVPARMEAAETLFREGRKVLVYPGGDVDSFRPTRERRRVRFDGRRGYARLAIRCGVPIVPVAAAGGQSTFWVGPDLLPLVERIGLTRRMRVKTWPVTFSIPWGLFPGPTPPFLPLPARILVRVLPPIQPPDADHNDEAAVEALDRRVRAALEAAVDELETEREQTGAWALRHRS